AQRRDDAAAVAHAYPPVGDDLEVDGLPRGNWPLADDDVVREVGDDLRAVEQRLERVGREGVQVGHGAHRLEQHAPLGTRRRRQKDLGREEAWLTRREAWRHVSVRNVDERYSADDGVRQAPEGLLVGVNGRDTGLVVEKVDGGLPVARPEEVHQVLEML